MTGSLNVLIERVAYRPLRNAPKLAPLITAVGFSFILQNVGLLWRGGSPQSVNDLVGQGSTVFNISGVPDPAGLHPGRRHDDPAGHRARASFIASTRLGRAMRATAQDPEAARLMGINVNQTISLTFLLGGTLAGAAGLVYALYQTNIWYFQGFKAGLIAFTAAVMGGIGNVRGAVLGGLIIGVIQSFSDNRLAGRGVDRGRRLRLSDPDHGPASAGAARRGDAGGRLMETPAATAPPAGASCGRSFASGAPPSIGGLPPWWRRAAGRPSLVVLAIVLPFAFAQDSGVHRRHDQGGSLAVMSLGLNIVVGFAGLLDLGYVAFYALGAYSLGWFGSDFFFKAQPPRARLTASPPPRPGSTSTSS